MIKEHLAIVTAAPEIMLELILCAQCDELTERPPFAHTQSKGLPQCLGFRKYLCTNQNNECIHRSGRSSPSTDGDGFPDEF